MLNIFPLKGGNSKKVRLFPNVLCYYTFFNPLNEQAQLFSSQKRWNAATFAKDVLLAAKNDLETAYKDCPPSQRDGAIVLNFVE
jgi:hypothetical protein